MPCRLFGHTKAFWSSLSPRLWPSMDCLAQRKTTVVTRPGHPKHGVLVIAETTAAEIDRGEPGFCTDPELVQHCVKYILVYSLLVSDCLLKKKRGEEYIHARTHTNTHFGECEGWAPLFPVFLLLAFIRSRIKKVTVEGKKCHTATMMSRKPSTFCFLLFWSFCLRIIHILFTKIFK